MTKRQPGEVLGQRFKLLSLLGSGRFGNTYAAQDLHTGEAVALKESDLRRVDDWKTVELFEREAATLQRLNHPGIPRYIDFIRDPTGAQALLVQAIAPGSTLEQLIERQGRFSEERTRGLAKQLLDILVYLDSSRPPVVHRDIKPDNILVDEQDRVHLVDFGSVARIAAEGSRGSTVAGTFGYMAPEQLHGEATTVSDLYALGMTLIHVVTGKRPEDLPKSHLRVQFRDAAPQLSPRFAQFIERLAEPARENRFQSAKDALSFMSQAPLLTTTPTSAAPDPSRASQPLFGSLGLMSFDAGEHYEISRFYPILSVLRIAAFAIVGVVLFDLLLTQGFDLPGQNALSVLFLIGGGIWASICISQSFVWLRRRSVLDVPFYDPRVAPGVVKSAIERSRSGEFGRDAVISATYVVSGQEYEVHTIFKESLERVQEIIANHPPSTPVEVHYEAHKPEVGSVRPATASPLKRLFQDVSAGAVFSTGAIGLAGLFAFAMGGSYDFNNYASGKTAINLSEHVGYQPLFFTEIGGAFLWLLLALGILGLTVGFDLVNRRSRLFGGSTYYLTNKRGKFGGGFFWGWGRRLGFLLGLCLVWVILMWANSSEFSDRFVSNQNPLHSDFEKRQQWNP